jgi:hypothetical protein
MRASCLVVCRAACCCHDDDDDDDDDGWIDANHFSACPVAFFFLGLIFGIIY